MKTYTLMNCKNFRMLSARLKRRFDLSIIDLSNYGATLGNEKVLLNIDRNFISIIVLDEQYNVKDIMKYCERFTYDNKRTQTHSINSETGAVRGCKKNTGVIRT